MPRESLLVELNHHLRAPLVGRFGEDEIGFVRVFPLHEEHQLAAGVRCADDLFGHEAPIETARRIVRVLVVFAAVLVGFVVFDAIVCGAAGRRGACVERGGVDLLFFVRADVRVDAPLGIQLGRFGLVFVLANQVRTIEVLFGLPCVVGAKKSRFKKKVTFFS